MFEIKITRLFIAAIFFGNFLFPVLAQSQILSRRIKQLSRATQWRQAATIAINFDTFHPQGMVKIGNEFFVSSVEVKTAPRKFAQPQNGYDRDVGEGRGHLFRFDEKGNLLADLKLGEGSIYHPGGIDFDGRDIWISVAEYRPNSQSIIYRVNPARMKAEEVFRFRDHLGGILHATEERALYAVNWGSRHFYRWKIDSRGRVIDSHLAPEQLRKLNHSFYIDYQDCKYLGQHEMLCAGLASYSSGPDRRRFNLGGFEIVDLRSSLAIHQVPIELWTQSGLAMTNNPFWVESITSGLRAYFMPEDNHSTLYVYEAETK